MNDNTTDVVYIYRKMLNNNDEILWSIKSLKNLAHRNVFVVGDRPYNLPEHVIYIPTGHNHPNPYIDQEIKWGVALQDDRISHNFIMMNDDFFVLSPIGIYAWHRGTLRDHLKNRIPQAGKYSQAMRDTLQLLEQMGIPEPLSYELHMPMIMNKKDRLKIDELIKKHKNKGLLSRSLYGNIFNIGGAEVPDCKHVEDYEGRTLLSTTEKTFAGSMGDYIKRVLA